MAIYVTVGTFVNVMCLQKLVYIVKILSIFFVRFIDIVIFFLLKAPIKCHKPSRNTLILSTERG